MAEAHGGGETGIGYTYAPPAAALVVVETLAPAVVGCDAIDTTAAWVRMQSVVRNAGRSGIAAAAISAVDAALWDLKGPAPGLSLAAKKFNLSGSGMGDREVPPCVGGA